MPYAKEDAPFFFGRGRERELITANLIASKLTLLYGPSGVGKSSVINAGVVWHLQEQARLDLEDRDTSESIVVTFNNWRDEPVAALKQRVSAAVEEVMPGQSCEGLESAVGFADYLHRWTECLNSDLLIILDQFEEYFLYHSHDTSEGSFAVEFPKALNQSDLRANFLISIREDSLAKLDFFKGTIPSLFRNYLRIEHLDREAARNAVEKPIQKYNSLAPANQAVEIEPGLVDAVLDQVKVGEVFLSSAGRGVVERQGEAGYIETPYLQLVMTRLWSEEVPAGSRVLRLTTLERLGGAVNIVRTHLDQSMSLLLLPEQDTAAKVFRYLVTPSGSKIALTVSDLEGYTELPAPQIQTVVDRLSKEVRILKPVTPVAGDLTATRYEIFHDVLAASILDWHVRHTQVREVTVVKKKVRSFIAPFVVGVVCDTILCCLPVGVFAFWGMLRTIDPPLKPELVKRVTTGWVIGAVLGSLLYYASNIPLLMLGGLNPEAEPSPILVSVMLGLYFSLFVTRLFGPIASLVMFYFWRRKELAKLTTKPDLINLATTPTRT
jgi:hypothetical protein